MPKSRIGFYLLITIIAKVSHADSLDSFLKKIKTQNLDISSQALLIEATEQKSKGYSLKPPMVGVSQMQNLMGKAYAFEAQQELPLSSKLSNDKKSREGMSEVQKKESSYVTDEILLQARLDYFRYWMVYNKIKLVEELETWLKHHALYAQSQVRSNADIKLYALEVESTIGMVQNEVSSLKEQLEIEKVKLKKISYDENYDPGRPSITDPEPFAVASSSSKISSINLSKLRVANSDLEIANASSAPNLFLKVRKLDRPMNGMANQEYMIGIDLPFAYFWQPRAEKAASYAQKYIAEARYKNSEIEGEALKISLQSRSKILKDQLDTLEKVSLPSAKKRLKYLKNISLRDINGLQSHYNIFKDYINFKMQVLEIRLRYEKLYADWTLLFSEVK